MDSVRLDNVLDVFHGRGLVLALLWLGLIVLIVALLVLMYTRWGTMRPLRKCLALSIGAHLLLVAYSATVYVAPAVPFFREQIIRVSLAEKPPPEPTTPQPPAAIRPGEKPTSISPRPWETFVGDPGPALAPIPVPRAPERELPIPDKQAVAESGALGLAEASLNKPLVEIATPPPPRTQAEATPSVPMPNRPAEPIEVPAPQGREGSRAEINHPAPFAKLTPITRPTKTPTRIVTQETPATILDRPLTVPPLKEIASGSDASGRNAAADSPPSKLPGSTLQATSTARGPAPEASPRLDTSAAAAARDAPNTAPLVANRLKPPFPAKEGLGKAADGDSPMAPGLGLAGLKPPPLPPASSVPGDHHVPEVYWLRLAPNRSQLLEPAGATPELETAVKAGLKWLADHQEPDGRWSPRRHEGGREIREAGRDRQGAGARADTGVTALAILAFAAAGNTHLEGTHHITVRRAVEFLLSKQDANGSLGGDAQLFEFMYCHGMATLALSELLGMTGDAKLRQPLARAVAYTLAAQDPVGGGWRYRPREAGDTSQFGWQIMALKSASLAGIPIPESTWRAAQRFLDSVSGGRHRGLAAYRPEEDFTRSMTAEALACRQFLGLANDSPTAKEAGDFLLGDLPGQGDPNLYYWYYASIAMYQLQGDYWKRWSEALRKTLLSTQRTAGTLAGSWDPNTRWDGYGGRVYSTALATLCLEAHYRYLPLNTLATVQPTSGNQR